MARRGAARVDPARGRTSGIRPPRARPEANEDEGAEEVVRVVPPAEPETEEWILEGVESEAHRAVRRGSAVQGRRKRSTVTDDRSTSRPTSRSSGGAPVAASGADAAKSEAFEGVGSVRRAKVLSERLATAAKAYKSERYGDAARILKPLASEAPGVAEVRELTGLTYYRLGRWKDALRELNAFVEITGSTEQHPVLADCARALGRFSDVEQYWDTLRRASPSADLMAEGRIVMAGALADRGRLAEAVSLMEAGRRNVKRPQERHLRSAYVLADLNERAGDVPAARSGFAWIEAESPGFGDVAQRLAALR